jgi:hypothetical protein
MTGRPHGGIKGAVTTTALRDADLLALHSYWLAKRGDRSMPARADIDPTEIKTLLPYLTLHDMAPPNRYRIRLVGTAIVDFVGRDFTGKQAGTEMPPEAARTMHLLLDTVAETRLPLFRAGKAWWWKEKAYRDFEACFLPLSADGKTVNMILGGVKTTLR